ncbi:MAG: hypothetical protein U0Q12_24750 [Vicinamibacterales bacterium]
MPSDAPRPFRAGQALEDYCRACKVDRYHTVIVVDGQGHPLRVACDYCRSEHNYRGGPRGDAVARPIADPRPRATQDRGPAGPAAVPDARLPLVSERERREPVVSPSGASEVDLERLMRRVIREEIGLTPVAPAERWRDGELVLRPGKPGLQEKRIPIETFFHKIVMLRNRLRTLEQQVNATDLPEDVKLKIQGYITGCYGSLTTFNVLFADEDDRFEGASQD